MDDPRARRSADWQRRRAPPSRTRAAAMRSLGQCSGDLRISAYLLKGTTDENSWVRYYACQALGRLAFEPATEALIRSLTDPAGQVRVAAVEALACLKSEAAATALKGAVTDVDSDIQRAALIGRGVAGRDESLPFMLATAKSTDPATRLSGHIGFRGVPRARGSVRPARCRVRPGRGRPENGHWFSVDDARDSRHRRPGRPSPDDGNDRTAGDGAVGSDRRSSRGTERRAGEGRRRDRVLAVFGAGTDETAGRRLGLDRRHVDAEYRGTEGGRHCALAATPDARGSGQACSDVRRRAIPEPEVRQICSYCSWRAEGLGMPLLPMSPQVFSITERTGDGACGIAFRCRARLRLRREGRHPGCGGRVRVPAQTTITSSDTTPMGGEKWTPSSKRWSWWETYLFRELAALEMMVAEIIVPRLHLPEGGPRIWCAACATGEKNHTTVARCCWRRAACTGQSRAGRQRH